MPSRDLTLWTFFVAGVLSVAIVLAAFLAALLIGQRRRIAMERTQAQRILAAQEEERSRVARELHDDALQRIAIIRHELDEASQHGTPEMVHRIEGVAGELADLGTVLRTAAHHLHPSVVEKAGLPRALGALAEEFGHTTGLAVRVAVPPADIAVPPATGVAAYRIAQEALRNVVKHAGVMQADLVLDLTGGTLTLRVSDTGQGFDAAGADRDSGLGIIAMRQRAEAVGGRLTLAARPGGGTEVTAVFPTLPTR